MRRDWYKIPNISTGEELIFFKRNHHYPKLMYNKDKVLTTDTAYKLKLNEGFESKSIMLSFYNIITLIFSELDGRYYSGGVLELVPNEFKQLPYLYVKYSEDEYLYLIEKMENEGIESILKYNDEKILKKILRLNDNKIKKIYKIWELLQKRRLKKK